MIASYKMLNLESPVMAERLAYLDFKLLFTGAISRKDIASEFSIARATAGVAVNLYREYRPENIRQDRNPNTCILARGNYRPLVEIEASIGLQMLTHGFDKQHFMTKPKHNPNLELAAVTAVTRAMANSYAISADLLQDALGRVNCLFYPQALIQEDDNWLIRGYNSTRQRYETLPFTALTRVHEHSDICAETEESLFYDPDWPKLAGNFRYTAPQLTVGVEL